MQKEELRKGLTDGYRQKAQRNRIQQESWT